MIFQFHIPIFQFPPPLTINYTFFYYLLIVTNVITHTINLIIYLKVVNYHGQNKDDRTH